MFSRWRSTSARRGALASRVPEGALRRYLETPPPEKSTPLRELPLLALDIETTGLDVRRDRVLSVGFVPVDGERIALGGAGSILIRPDHDDGPGVGQSAVFHGLTDDALDAGVPVEEALDPVLDALRGRVLLAHFAHLEVGFLGALCERVHGVRPPFVVVDTLELQRRILRGGIDMGFSAEPTAGEVRLWACRERYGLPVYRAHDALVDSLACAELYLAQNRELAERGVSSLGDLVWHPRGTMAP